MFSTNWHLFLWSPASGLVHCLFVCICNQINDSYDRRGGTSYAIFLFQQLICRQKTTEQPSSLQVSSHSSSFKSTFLAITYHLDFVVNDVHWPTLIVASNLMRRRRSVHLISETTKNKTHDFFKVGCIQWIILAKFFLANYVRYSALDYKISIGIWTRLFATFYQVFAIQRTVRAVPRLIYIRGIPCTNTLALFAFFLSLILNFLSFLLLAWLLIAMAHNPHLLLPCRW